MTKRAPYQTLAAEGLRALGGVYSYVAKCGLEKPLLDLAFLRASQINGCAYCIDAHSADARRNGTSPERLALLSAWRECGGLFSERERSALAWTESSTFVAVGHGLCGGQEVADREGARGPHAGDRRDQRLQPPRDWLSSVAGFRCARGA